MPKVCDSAVFYNQLMTLLNLICRNEALEEYPELKEILNTLAGAVDDATIQDLNYQVDVEKRSVEDVAKEFLTNNGYI